MRALTKSNHNYARQHRTRGTTVFINEVSLAILTVLLIPWNGSFTSAVDSPLNDLDDEKMSSKQSLAIDRYYALLGEEHKDQMQRTMIDDNKTPSSSSDSSSSLLIPMSQCIERFQYNISVGDDYNNDGSISYMEYFSLIGSLSNHQTGCSNVPSKRTSAINHILSDYIAVACLCENYNVYYNDTSTTNNETTTTTKTGSSPNIYATPLTSSTSSGTMNNNPKCCNPIVDTVDSGTTASTSSGVSESSNYVIPYRDYPMNYVYNICVHIIVALSEECSSSDTRTTDPVSPPNGITNVTANEMETPNILDRNRTFLTKEPYNGTNSSSNDVYGVTNNTQLIPSSGNTNGTTTTKSSSTTTVTTTEGDRMYQQRKTLFIVVILVPLILFGCVYCAYILWNKNNRVEALYKHKKESNGQCIHSSSDESKNGGNTNSGTLMHNVRNTYINQIFSMLSFIQYYMKENTKRVIGDSPTSNDEDTEDEEEKNRAETSVKVNQHVIDVDIPLSNEVKIESTSNTVFMLCNDVHDVDVYSEAVAEEINRLVRMESGHKSNIQATSWQPDFLGYPNSTRVLQSSVKIPPLPLSNGLTKPSSQCNPYASSQSRSKSTDGVLLDNENILFIPPMPNRFAESSPSTSPTSSTSSIDDSEDLSRDQLMTEENSSDANMVFYDLNTSDHSRGSVNIHVFDDSSFCTPPGYEPSIDDICKYYINDKQSGNKLVNEFLDASEQKSIRDIRESRIRRLSARHCNSSPGRCSIADVNNTSGNHSSPTTVMCTPGISPRRIRSAPFLLIETDSVTENSSTHDNVDDDKMDAWDEFEKQCSPKADDDHGSISVSEFDTMITLSPQFKPKLSSKNLQRKYNRLSLDYIVPDFNASTTTKDKGHRNKARSSPIDNTSLLVIPKNIQPVPIKKKSIRNRRTKRRSKSFSGCITNNSAVESNHDQPASVNDS